MTADVSEKLGQFLREGQDWEKKPTNIPGASLLKLPAFKKSPPSIAIEINPINASTGSGTKKRGIIIRSGSEQHYFKIICFIGSPYYVDIIISSGSYWSFTAANRTVNAPCAL
jgi:hypothetical protein